MEMKPVKSSQIEAIGYDPGTKKLAVRFKNGQKLYHYEDVTPDDFAKLQSAESVGKHFHANIRGKFKHTLQDEKIHGKAEKK